VSHRATPSIYPPPFMACPLSSPTPRLIALVGLALALLCGTTPAVAEPLPPEVAKKEASDRFDQGLRLFEEGDNAGALAEFRRAYELLPMPSVLFNIGLVCAQMGRPVDAADSLDRVLSNPGDLGADDLAKAARVRAEQLRRIGTVTVELTTPGAVVEVDGVDVGRTPFSQPIRVSVGTHAMAVLAPGYHPARQAITLAGGESRVWHPELVRLDTARARLRVKSGLPDAEVLVDGKSRGRTPLGTELSVAPGTHRVELRRPGYVTEVQTVTVAEGADTEIAIDPDPDPSALGASGQRVAIVASEPGALVRVDGKNQPPMTESVLLLPGTHLVRVERSGFFPAEQSVKIASSGSTSSVRIDLVPTPETRADYERSARSQRTWAWITIGAGAVVTGGSVAFLFYNQGQVKDAQKKYDAVVYQSEDHSGRNCDPFRPGFDRTQCEAALDGAYQKLEDTKHRNIIGYVGVGVGGAAMVTGAVLLVVSKDPDHYRTKSGALGPEVRWQPWFGLGAAGVEGRF
jgi:tetratricopeptide (TPR) repeat protein